MASIEFWGGLGVIGSSKIMVSHGEHRVLLDIGVDIPSGANLFRAPVLERHGHELADRLRVGGAPHIAGLFDPAFLPPGDPLATPFPGRTAVFVSHPHIDHVGLAGFVRPEVPVHASAETVALLGALAEAGDEALLDRCSVILRLAEHLERGRDQSVSHAKLRANGHGVDLHLEAEGDLMLPRWSVERYGDGDAFKRVFGRRLLIG